MERVEEHERVNGLFKNKGEMYVWVLTTQYKDCTRKICYFKDENNGQKFCSLCLAKRVNIIIAMNSEGSNKVMNKNLNLLGHAVVRQGS